MKTLLVILNYNSYYDLVKLVNNLLLNCDKFKYTIIVIDNCSIKDREELDDYFHSKKAFFINEIYYQNLNDNESLIYLKMNENIGYSRGNNLGLKIGYDLGFDVAFIINPDVEIPNLEVFEDAAYIFNNNKKIGVLGYQVVLPNGENQGPFRYELGWDLVFRNLFFPFYSFWKNFLWYIEKKRKGYITVPCVVGCFVGLNLKYLHSVNFYDENVFLYYEEQIISAKMRMKGYLTVYRNNYFVRHNHLYVQDLCHNSKFVESKNYYIEKYLVPSSILIRILNFSQKYYNIFWKKLSNK
jgi:GT2 family glycosyltransferase